MGILNKYNPMSVTPERYALSKMIGNNRYPPRPEDYEFSVEGLNEFIVQVGAGEFLSGVEICRPHNMEVADELGIEWLIPPQESWEVVGVLAIIHRNCRVKAQSPIYVRNCHRPTDYNNAVGGSKGSDHLNGRAFDMDFVDHNARARVDSYIESLYRTGYLDLSVGKGDAMYHIGVLSDNHHRRWNY